MWPLGTYLPRLSRKPGGQKSLGGRDRYPQAAASWLFMSFMFSLAFGAAAIVDNGLLRVVAFVVLFNLLLPLASLVSPSRKAFPPREKFEIHF
jgi:hypothetical protein